FEHVAVALADGLEGFAPAAAEGAVLGGHKFDGYRTEKGKTRAGEITLHAALDDEDVAHAQVIGEAVALIKDLVNVPAEWQSPAQLAQSAADS
ncbi:leucyl aminopeptidase, partial [Brachybacterium paraconglomeratum]|nr:leucyl aminopeptidase [Brachybacterium paraconglomeratum]